MNLTEYLNQLFLKQMLVTPRGRAMLLAQLADAEGGNGGELAIFEHVLAVLDDSKLRQWVKRHQEDEERHERLFLECAQRTEEQLQPVPEEAKMLRQLDKRTGFFSRTVTEPAHVMEAYLLLLVIEERAIEQFQQFVPAFAEVDPAVAEVLREVAADEQRHLRYCHAISKKYAPSEEVRLKRLHELRVLEAQSFKTVNRFNLSYSLKLGLIQGKGWQFFWKAIGWVAKWDRRLLLTRFGQMNTPEFAGAV